MLNRGSEWRRWEPHIHAPGTVMNDQFGGPNAWHDYLTALERAMPTIEAVAVTDYYVNLPLDGGDGLASVKLGAADKKATSAMDKRLKSDLKADPITGADLGAGPGAGKTTPVPVS